MLLFLRNCFAFPSSLFPIADGNGLIVSISTMLFSGPFPPPLIVFAQSFHGAMHVRTGINRNLQLNWMHALLLTIVSGNGGSIVTPTGMGQSMIILSNDFAILCCIVSFLMVNHFPWVVQKVQHSTLIMVLLTTSSQIYRTTHTIHYTSKAFRYFAGDGQFQSSNKPTNQHQHNNNYNTPKIYPIPIFGPILYGTFFGCMSGCLQKAFHSRLQREGLPRTIQNSKADFLHHCCSHQCLIIHIIDHHSFVSFA